MQEISQSVPTTQLHDWWMWSRNVYVHSWIPTMRASFSCQGWTDNKLPSCIPKDTVLIIVVNRCVQSKYQSGWVWQGPWYHSCVTWVCMDIDNAHIWRKVISSEAELMQMTPGVCDQATCAATTITDRDDMWSALFRGGMVLFDKPIHVNRTKPTGFETTQQSKLMPQVIH